MMTSACTDRDVKVYPNGGKGFSLESCSSLHNKVSRSDIPPLTADNLLEEKQISLAINYA